MSGINKNEISWTNRLRMVKAFYSVVQDVERTNEVFQMSEKIPDSVVQETVDRLAQSPGTKEAFESREILPHFDFAAMQNLPEGTLGKTYADLMVQRHLDQDFHPTFELVSGARYLRLHLYQTHDIWHVVTGFKADPAGELGLQAFYYAQLELPLPILLLSAGLLNGLLYNPTDLTNRLEHILRGWQMGRAAKPLFGFAWVKHLDQPLEQVRAKLGVAATGSALPEGSASHAVAN